TALPAQSLFPLVRSVLAWFGLALVSGCLLGWRLSWLVPAMAGSALTYWTSDDLAPWWDVAGPSTSLASAVVSVACLALGLGAYRLTAWRRRSLFAALRGAAVGSQRSV